MAPRPPPPSPPRPPRRRSRPAPSRSTPRSRRKTSPGTSPPPRARRPAAIKTGGALVAAREVDLVRLDPDTSSNFSALQAYEQVYESLTGYNARTEIIPALATSWETPDPQTYIYHFRQGVKFHDGSELTADDVAYSLERGYGYGTGATAFTSARTRTATSTRRSSPARKGTTGTATSRWTSS